MAGDSGEGVEPPVGENEVFVSAMVHPQLDIAMKLVSLLDMKATIDFDPVLYRRLKVEAARRGRTVRDLVAEGVRSVLDNPVLPESESGTQETSATWRPAWLGSLRKYGLGVTDHSMAAVRESVARGRSAEKQK